MDFGIKKKKKTIKPDKSDFSTQKTKPNVSDFANKNKFKPKVTVKDTSGKFSSDAGVKPSVNTFTADTNAAKNTDKDRSDFAGGKKTSKTSKTTKTTKTDKKVKKTTTSKISPRGLAFRAARKANKKVFEFPKGSGKMFTTNLKGEDKKNTKTKKVVKKATSSVVQPPKRAPRGANKIVSSMKSSKAGVDAAPGDNKKSKSKFFKGTNITPTATQQKRRRNT